MKAKVDNIAEDLKAMYSKLCTILATAPHLFSETQRQIIEENLKLLVLLQEDRNLGKIHN
ncbi:hypothetical protein TSUD_228250 [Trifolium subterraneum]|uniref:Uncharacterized protein n=1 Tax=Trifolium subterraneum TaxID=3900 RepID=A0A2Z6MRG1_TRISU|nr:hypothetical protein TSUD_228250 [Trifolium subterraneum]